MGRSISDSSPSVYRQRLVDGGALLGVQVHLQHLHVDEVQVRGLDLGVLEDDEGLARDRGGRQGGVEALVVLGKAQALLDQRRDLQRDAAGRVGAVGLLAGRHHEGIDHGGGRLREVLHHLVLVVVVETLGRGDEERAVLEHGGQREIGAHRSVRETARHLGLQAQFAAQLAGQVGVHVHLDDLGGLVLGIEAAGVERAVRRQARGHGGRVGAVAVQHAHQVAGVHAGRLVQERAGLLPDAGALGFGGGGLWLLLQFEGSHSNPPRVVEIGLRTPPGGQRLHGAAPAG
ncbi:hypothetical protein ACOTJN_10090, partial [Achromobacter xylosoxidans]